MEYRLSYSGEQEFVQTFNNMRDLRKVLNAIPDYLLKNSAVIKVKNGHLYVGQYYKGKTGLLVRF